ncbi:hypothetical protein DRN98_03415 [Methanosarcinales archaeon]|nr:MAG: hypothetical protein DRN98_03415 [Methanosarcinales archaeon]
MRPLARLKEDIDFNKNLSDIIDILKIASSIQLRQFQLQEKIENEEFDKGLIECAELLRLKGIRHPFFETKEGPLYIVIVSSDEGFLGELNILLVNTGLNQRRNREDFILVLGEKGASYLEDMKESFLFLEGVSDEISEKEVVSISKFLIKEYLDKNISKILIVYPKFVTISSQVITVETLLPLGIILREERVTLDKEQLLIEPSEEEVIEGLVNLWFKFHIFKILFSSKLSEFSARVMHLEASSQELSQINQRLKFEYFKNLHIMSDNSIRESSATKNIWKK